MNIKKLLESNRIVVVSETFKVKDGFVEVEFGKLTGEMAQKICNKAKECNTCPLNVMYDGFYSCLKIARMKHSDRLAYVVKIPQKYFDKGEKE